MKRLLTIFLLLFGCGDTESDPYNDLDFEPVVIDIDLNDQAPQCDVFVNAFQAGTRELSSFYTVFEVTKDGKVFGDSESERFLGTCDEFTVTLVEIVHQVSLERFPCERDCVLWPG